MLEYGGAIGAQAPGLAAPPAGAGSDKTPLHDLLRLALAHRLLIAVFMLAGAVTGVVLSKTLPPRYLAVAQIYLDPRGLPGAERDPSSAQDSTGYINLVESQARIVSSQLVLDRVVAAEALDKDPEFVPKGFSLFGSLLGAQDTAGEATRAAVRALTQRLTVRRPERTFIIEIGVGSRDPVKAARLANAVAHAFIEVQSVLYAQSARETSTVLTARLAQNLTIANNETAVRLRDLEREADAMRTLYEIFLNRARRSGEAPNIDGTSTHIVIAARREEHGDEAETPVIRTANRMLLAQAPPHTTKRNGREAAS